MDEATSLLKINVNDMCIKMVSFGYLLGDILLEDHGIDQDTNKRKHIFTIAIISSSDKTILSYTNNL